MLNSSFEFEVSRVWDRRTTIKKEKRNRIFYFFQPPFDLFYSRADDPRTAREGSVALSAVGFLYSISYYACVSPLHNIHP